MMIFHQNLTLTVTFQMCPAKLPLMAFMMGRISSDQVLLSIVLKTVPLSRSHRPRPTSQIWANSAVSDFTEAGIRFHRNLALQLKIKYSSSIIVLFLLIPPTKWRYRDITMCALYFLSKETVKAHRREYLTCDWKTKEGKGKIEDRP